MDAAIAAWVERLAGFPAWIETSAASIPASKATWRPKGAEFSWVEQLCHLRDIEREAYHFRIVRILEENERPLFADFNGSAIAVERKYQTQDPVRAFNTYRAERARNVDILRSVSDAQLERRGTFGGIEGFPLSQLIGWMISHDADHQGQIEALIAAGRATGAFA